MPISIHIQSVKKTLPAGVWAFVLHDYDTALYNHLPRPLFDPKDKLKDDQGWPEMVPFSPRLGVDLTYELQWFWVKQLVLSKYQINLLDRFIGERRITIEEDFYSKLNIAQQEYIKEAWRGLTKSWTALMNGAGTEEAEGRRNYINGWNTNSRQYPRLWENSCGGNLLALFDDIPRAKGYKVRTLDPSRYGEWKNYNYVTHPEYFNYATNSTPRGFNNELTREGPWKVDPFHYLGGRSVPFPKLSAGGFAYVATDRVRIMKQGERFPPYPYNP